MDTFSNFQFQNGLKAYVSEFSGVAWQNVAIIVRRGACYGKSGLAHFAEHAILGYLASQESVISDMGGSLKIGNTNFCTISSSCLIPANEKSLNQIMDMYRGALFADTISPAKERKIVEKEALLKAEDFVSMEMRYNIFAEAEWAHQGTIGEPSSLSDLDVQDFFNRYFKPNNITLVIAGGLSVETCRLAIESWSSIASGEIHAENLVLNQELFNENCFGGGKTIIGKKPHGALRCMIRLPDGDERFDHLFSEALYDALYKVFRVELEAVYAVDCSSPIHLPRGLRFMEVFIDTLTKDVLEVSQEIFEKCLDAICSKEVFERYKARLLNRYILKGFSDSFAEQFEGVVERLLFHERIISPEEERQCLVDSTAEEYVAWAAQAAKQNFFFIESPWHKEETDK